MNYTKNYHLPQWVKSDRIMMEDFNAMCASIENGLSAVSGESAKTKADLAEGLKNAEDRAVADRTREAEALLRGMGRLARNQFRALPAGMELPWQMGVFRQAMSGSAAPAGGSGVQMAEGQAWVISAASALTGSALQETFQEIQEIRVRPGNPEAERTGIFTFTAPGPGVLKSFRLSSSYNTANGALELRMRMTDTGNGELLVDRTFQTQNFSGSGSATIQIEPNRTVHTGCAYRIELEPLNSPGNFGFGRPSNVQVEALQNSGPGVLAYTMSGQETSAGGLVLVRFRAYGEGGSFSLVWNGRTLSPAVIRTITGPNGETCREAEFRYDEPLPASAALRLTATAKSGGELGIFDWGAILV